MTLQEDTNKLLKKILEELKRANIYNRIKNQYTALGKRYQKARYDQIKYLKLKKKNTQKSTTPKKAGHNYRKKKAKKSITKK